MGNEPRKAFSVPRARRTLSHQQAVALALQQHPTTGGTTMHGGFTTATIKGDTAVGGTSTATSASGPSGHEELADAYNARALRAIEALADAVWPDTAEEDELEDELDQIDALLAAAEKLPLAAGGGHLRVVRDLLA